MSSLSNQARKRRRRAEEKGKTYNVDEEADVGHHAEPVVGEAARDWRLDSCSIHREAKKSVKGRGPRDERE